MGSPLYPQKRTLLITTAMSALNLGSVISWLRIGLCAAQVGHQEAWMATKIGLPAFCAAAKASGVKASVSVANAGAAKAAVAATAASSAERRESMVEVLLAFVVVVLQRALVARSHKLPGTHQLSVNWRRHSSGAAQPLDQAWTPGEGSRQAFKRATA